MTGLKKGISGILRIKNDGQFIESCVESCIHVLDELVVVYNDCVDNSVEEIERMRCRYPGKIKVYEYPYKILAHNLSEDEYAEAIALPKDSPLLLCNYYNFALSKVSYCYAMKIDADQFYFKKDLKRWCDLTRISSLPVRWRDYIKGRCLFEYFRLYRKLSLKVGRRLPCLPKEIIIALFESYRHFAEIEFLKGNVALSLSGLNVFHNVNRSYVTVGYANDYFNIMPPFNGENDHLIFKVTKKTYYRRFAMDYYGKLRNTGRSLIEEMVHPYIPVNVGFCWTHVNADRIGSKDKIINLMGEVPEKFLEVKTFLGKNFKDIEKMCDYRMFTLYQRILFSFIYDACKRELKENL